MDEIPPGFRPCVSCIQSCYKEHWPFPNRDSFRAPCFVKALCDSNLAAMATCWMVIPSAWLKLYGDDVGNSAILLGPSGNTWQVGVSRPKWVAFRVGWRTFAADNCLEKGDMLVFTLIGKSKFSVKIFDSRTCLEKESSLTATNTGCYDSRSPVLLGEKRKQRDGCENVAELKRICLNENGAQLGNNDQALELFRNGNALQQSGAKISIFSSAAALISQRKCPLLDLNSKPLNIHQNPTNDGGNNFPEVNQQLLDAVDARTLQEYNASGVVYQPHPISIRSHDVEEECSQGQLKPQECGSRGIGPATRFAAQRRPVMDSTTRERLSEYQCRQNSSSALITSEPSSQALDSNREQYFAEAVGPQILYGGRDTYLLSPLNLLPLEENTKLFEAIRSPAVILERGKALELARRAQDTIDRPSHLVVLRAFHVHGRAFVRFPVTFGKQHMPRKTAPMHLLDSNGHQWPMTWLRDNETHMGLTRGWRDFCLAEGLSEGDVCIFELIEFHKLTLLIHVFRSTETRGNSNTQSQIIVTKSKRPLDLPHAHKKKPNFETRRKILEDSADRRGQQMIREDQMICLEDRSRPHEYHNSTHVAGSVGRVRLKKLKSLWASKSKGDQAAGCFKRPTGYMYSRESESGLQLKSSWCSSKEYSDVVDDHGDMSNKAQDCTTASYGEILCQMSSGCGNIAAADTTNSEKLLAPATSACIGLTGNVDHGKVSMGKHEDFEDRQKLSHTLLDRCIRRNHGHANTISGRQADHKRRGVILAIGQQWARSQKLRHRKADNLKKTWSNSAPSSGSALKRKIIMQLAASNRSYGPGRGFYNNIAAASRRSRVTQAQKEGAKEAAQVALNTSENPATLVVMKNSNVYNTFSVELPPSFSRLLQSSGDEERINCTIFLSDAAGHKTRKAHLTDQGVITRGWRQFSLEHLLEEGDVCVFELTDISQLTLLVHIFRVVDVDHLSTSYRNHYRFISPGMQLIRRPTGKNISRKSGNGQDIVKEINATTISICQPRRRNSFNKSLYLALRKTRAKHTMENNTKWLDCRTDEQALDLNLNLDPANVQSSPNAPIDYPSSCRTISTSCAWRTSISNHCVDTVETLHSKEMSGYAHQQLSPISNVNHDTISGTSPFRNPKDVYETYSDSQITGQQIDVSGEKEKMVMMPRLPAADEDSDSEPEEENYYRVVRILKKRYVRNEKQYLTEIDGPVVQSTAGCEGIKDHDSDIKWWVPEKSFSSGFASCYLR